MTQNSYFAALPLNQKIRWILHYGKTRFRNKEREQCWALASHVPPGSTIYDIGANVGKFTKEFASAHNGQTQVVAFEPGEYCLSILNRVAGRMDNVEVVEAGVAETDGKDELKKEDPWEEVPDNFVMAQFMSIRLRSLALGMNHPIRCSEWWGPIAEATLKKDGYPYEWWDYEKMLRFKPDVNIQKHKFG